MTRLSDAEQIALIEKYSGYIEEMEDPCEEAQILAIRKNPSLIKFIKNPSKKVINEEVKRNPNSEGVVDDLPETTQIMWVKMSPAQIGRIENPCELAQIIAFKADYKLYESIKNPCETIKKFASLLKLHDEYAHLDAIEMYKSLPKADDKMRFDMAFKSPEILNVHPELIEKVLQTRPNALQYIKNPDGPYVTKHLEKHPECIKHIPFPKRIYIDLVLGKNPEHILDINANMNIKQLYTEYGQDGEPYISSPFNYDICKVIRLQKKNTSIPVVVRRDASKILTNKYIYDESKNELVVEIPFWWVRKAYRIYISISEKMDWLKVREPCSGKYKIEKYLIKNPYPPVIESLKDLGVI